MTLIFPPWRRVTVGSRKTAAEYVKAIEAMGNELNPWPRQLAAKTPVATSPVEYELVRVTGEQLGFRKSATGAVIFERAGTFDLIPCPAEVGPALREQYQEQPEGWLLVAMEPIGDAVGDLGVFRVARDSDGRWLDAYYDDPGLGWAPSVRWVFLRRRPRVFGTKQSGRSHVLST